MAKRGYEQSASLRDVVPAEPGCCVLVDRASAAPGGCARHGRMASWDREGRKGDYGEQGESTAFQGTVRCSVGARIGVR